jgi:hypothetical protein
MYSSVSLMLGVDITVMFRNFDITKIVLGRSEKQCFKINGTVSHIFILFS